MGVSNLHFYDLLMIIYRLILGVRMLLPVVVILIYQSVSSGYTNGESGIVDAVTG